MRENEVPSESTCHSVKDVCSFDNEDIFGHTALCVCVCTQGRSCLSLRVVPLCLFYFLTTITGQISGF